MTLYANATVANNGCLSPANAHGAPDGTWTTNNGDSEDWDCRWGMENPAADLADTQDIQVTVRKNATGGNGNPTVTVELWESGSQITTLQGSTAISSTTGVQVGGTFDASVLSDISGAGIQVRVISAGVGGMPAGRRSIQVDGITYEENLSFTEPPTTAPTLSKVDRSTTTIDLEWNELEDATEYELYRDDALIYDGSDLEFQDTGLTGNTTYKYNILAKNPLGDGPMSSDYFFDSGPFPPLAPLLTFPADEANHDGTSFEWDFQTDNEGIQESFALRVASEGDLTTTDTDLGGLYRPTWSRFSRDGAYLAQVQSSVSPWIQVRDTSDWSLVSLPTPSGSIRCVAWSEDGSMLAIGINASPWVQVIDTSNWTFMTVSNANLTGSVNAIAFVGNAYLVAGMVSGSDNFLVLDTSDWSTESSGLLDSFGTQPNAISASWDGAWVVAYMNSRNLILVDTSDWSIVHNEVTGSDTAHDVVISPDSSWVAHIEQVQARVTIRDRETWSTDVITVPGNLLGQIDFSPDSDYVACTSRAENAVYVVNRATSQLEPGDHTSLTEPQGAFFSPTGDHLGVHQRFIINSAPFTRIYDWHPLQSFWWDGTDFVGSEVLITSADESVQIPSGAWDGVFEFESEIEWSVKTVEEDVGAGPYSSKRVFTLTSVDPSLAPTLLTPVDTASVDPGSVQHTWEYNSESEDTQTRFAFRRTKDSDHEWWDGTGWVGVETFIDSTDEFVTVDWSDPDNLYEWTVRTQGSGGVGPYATPFTLTVNTYPNAPTLVSPPDQGSVLPNDLSFSWSAHEGQSHYVFKRFPLGMSGRLLDHFHPWDGGAAPSLPRIVSSGTNHYLAAQPYPTGSGDDARTIMQIFPEALSTGDDVRTLLSLGSGSTIQYNLFARPDGQALFATRQVTSTPHEVLYVISPTTLATDDVVEVPGWSSSTSQSINHRAAVSPDSTLFAIYTSQPESSNEGSRLRVLDTTTWNDVFDGDFLAGNLTAANFMIPAFTTTGDKLAVLYSGGSLYIHTVSNWNTDTHANLLPTLESDPNRAWPTNMIWSNDGSKIIITTELADQDYEEDPSHFYVYNASNMSLDTSAPVIQVRCFRVYQYENILIVAVDGAPYIRFFDMTTWDEIDWPHSDVSISSNISISSSGLNVWEVDGEPYLLVRTDSTPHLHIFGPDGATWWDGTSWVGDETWVESSDEFVNFPEGSWDE